MIEISFINFIKLINSKAINLFKLKDSIVIVYFEILYIVEI